MDCLNCSRRSDHGLCQAHGLDVRQIGDFCKWCVMKPTLKFFTCVLIDFAVSHARQAIDRPEALTVRWLEANSYWKERLMKAWMHASIADVEPPLVIMYAFRSAKLQISSIPLVGELKTRAHTVLDQAQELFEFFSVMAPNFHDEIFT